ncbi:MAG: hypothetical protein HC815_36735, partial [Richelia sp. RM1_1_1]|nr:hypothetical protein [Richelia sp. RM1_1_1]
MIAALPTAAPPSVVTLPGANNISPGPNNVSISSVRPSDAPGLAQYFGPEDLVLFKPSVPQVIGVAGGAVVIAKAPLPKSPLIPPPKPFDPRNPPPELSPLVIPYGNPGIFYTVTYKFFTTSGNTFNVFAGKSFWETFVSYKSVELVEGPIFGIGITNPGWKPFIEHEVGSQVVYLVNGKPAKENLVASGQNGPFTTFWNAEITSIAPVITPDEIEEAPDPTPPPIIIPDTPPPLPRPKVPGQEGPDEIKPFKRPSPAPAPDPPPAPAPPPVPAPRPQSRPTTHDPVPDPDPDPD